MILPLLFLSCLNVPDLSPVAMARDCNEPKVVLVSEGHARMPIVTVDGRRERQAALYLASTIRDMTGVRPDVMIERPSCLVTNRPVMRIAKADDSDAFRVITKDGSIRFLGRSDYAVYDWCERVLGVRNYCKNGKTVLHSRDLAVEAVDYADQPVFACRKSGAPRIWAITAKSGGTHKGGVNVHQPHRWFQDPDVRTNHPNIFARQPDGSRGEMPLLCYGNPETLVYYKQRIDAHIAGLRDSGGIVDTNRHVITVSHWDVPLACTCQYCRKLFDPSLGVSGSGSPIIWGYFLKNLASWAAKAHPDYTISFLPYLNVCDVPKGLDLTHEGNCEAMLCSMPGLAMFKEPGVREHEESLILDWARVTGRRVLNWHYGCWPREYTSAPYLYGKTIAEHYRRMMPFEVGSYICGGSGSAAEELSIYVWHKCLWNPAIDVEAVYDVFADRMFGPAAKPMRRLMTMQEDGWNRHWPWPHCHMANTFGISYRPDEIVAMKRLLCEAAACAKGDPLALKRVRWYAADFARFFREEEHYRANAAFAPLEIFYANVTPEIDGDLSDDCWRTAPKREFIPAFADSSIRRHTRVCATWTYNGVYFACRCHEPDMAHLNLSAAYGELQKQDTLELFFDASGGTTGTCHRLMFDARGRLSATASDAEWSAEGVEFAVVRDAEEWRIEVFIPFASLVGPVSREHWRGNFTRWHAGRKDERERSRLATLDSEINQDRDAFCEFPLYLKTL